VNVRVDAPVWSLALRRSARNLNPREKAIVAELAGLINEGRARLIGLIRQELLSGIKNAGQLTKLRRTCVHSRMIPSKPQTMRLRLREVMNVEARAWLSQS